MKINIKGYVTAVLIVSAVVGMVSCNKFLDRKPYNVSTDAFFKSDADLYAYSIARYGMFPVNGGYNVGVIAETDNGTDNQVVQNSMGTRWLPGEWKVPQSGNWNFGDLYTVNYFLRNVMPKYEKGEITGSVDEIKQAIGEIYFFRAYYYFNQLKSVGDFPIIYDVLPDQKEPLLAASVRQPRNKVARMILTDLDSAYTFLLDAPRGGKNRLTKDASKLFRSRVALYEGTWEKNFAGTAFVPNGSGWPGKEQHPSYAYDNAAEVAYFLGEAMKDAKIVADKYTLAENPVGFDYTRNDGSSGSSEYLEMFGSPNNGLDKVNEVLLYKRYDFNLQIAHYVGSYIITGAGTGFTHQFMQRYLMQNGLPYYAIGSGYLGDDSVNMMKVGRDSRMQLFVKGQGDILNDGAKNKEPYMPPLLGLSAERSTTGYMIKKGISRDPSQTNIGSYGTTGCIIFRAAEAYLNYVEACYEKTGSLDGDATKYWKAIRKRALVSEDLDLTNSKTDMTKEAIDDLAAYTAGQIIPAMRYNIRRERRCEFIAEGMRMDDLKRWRALDQLATNKFMPKGFNLWSEMYKRMVDKDGNNTLSEPTPSETGNVSAKNDPYAEGKYLIPLRLNIAANNLYKEGASWTPAHYLNPIGAKQFLDATDTPTDGSAIDVAKSMIYQNPGWQKTANTGPGVVGGF